MAIGPEPRLPSSPRTPIPWEQTLSTFLQQACAAARDRVAAAQRARPEADLRAAVVDLSPPPSFAAALSGSGISLIAEVKRASPSRGPMAAIPDPAALARAYRVGGAAAISVLTEPQWFLGTLDDLQAVAAAVDLPVLRKDFVLDPYQILEARLAGAAAVLLIVAALDDETLPVLLLAAAAQGLDALVEVHDPSEGERAARAIERTPTDRQAVVGVNARDLARLTVDPDRFAAVRSALPPGALTVAESGVHAPADVARLAALGADAVLVGERVATAPDPAAAVADLLAGDAHRAAAPAAIPQRSTR